MPETTARIQQPKYFEQNVSDYSDVVPLLQKVYQDTEHRDFLSTTHFGRQKEKRSRQNYKKKCRSGRVYLRKDPCKSSTATMNRDDVEMSVVDSCVYWLSTLLSIC